MADLLASGALGRRDIDAAVGWWQQAYSTDTLDSLWAAQNLAVEKLQGESRDCQEDLRLLNAAMTAHENWLHPDEVHRLYQFRRQVEIGWALSVKQREEVERMVERSRDRRRTPTTSAR